MQIPIGIIFVKPNHSNPTGDGIPETESIRPQRGRIFVEKNWRPKPSRPQRGRIFVDRAFVLDIFYLHLLALIPFGFKELPEFFFRQNELRFAGIDGNTQHIGDFLVFEAFQNI